MKKTNKQSPYFVSFDTFLLQPVFKNGRVETRIIERNKELYSAHKPLNLVKIACKDYGNVFKNLEHRAKIMLKKSHKMPIVLAHDLGQPFVFIPIMSAHSADNIWIALHAIENVEPDEMGCIVHLINGYSVKINASEATFFRQFSLGTLLKQKYQNQFRQLHRTRLRNNSDFDFDFDLN